MTISTGAAHYARSPELGNSAWYVGNLFSFLADSGDTGGALSIMECTAPKEAVPPPHTHEREDELFYVLEGSGHWTCDGETYEASPGTLIYLPRGKQHGFTLTSPTARMLIIVTPAGFEGYFKELSEAPTALELPPPLEGPPDVDRLVEVGLRYGVTFAAPPPPDSAGPVL